MGQTIAVCPIFLCLFCATQHFWAGRRSKLSRQSPHPSGSTARNAANGEAEVPDGKAEVTVGEAEVPVGNGKVPVGNGKVPVGNALVPDAEKNGRSDFQKRLRSFSETTAVVFGNGRSRFANAARRFPFSPKRGRLWKVNSGELLNRQPRCGVEFRRLSGG